MLMYGPFYFSLPFYRGDMTTRKSVFLSRAARDVADQLSRHPVLSRHWPQLSLIMKGSTARGNADRYSDIDLVMYCDARARNTIVSGYYKAGLAQRQDGIFMFFAGPGYDGHYHVESFDQLEGYFRGGDFIHAWEYQQVVALHDPENHFTDTVTRLTRGLFVDPLQHVKRAYLDLQLDLDWMRHPLKRGDGVSAWLHAASITRGLCRISYLLDARPYPPDKWLVHYLRGTRFGKLNASRIAAYTFSAATAQSLTRHLSLEQYPLYAGADALIRKVGLFIRRVNGNAPWIERWYDHV
jgi:hypothetical protein